jgi:rhodanese-related sulfurtransferase
MTTITPVELQQLLAAQPGTILLDVRTPVEFAEVHVAQARNLPLDQFRPAALSGPGEVRKDKPIYLLCRSGARAQKAAQKLSQFGFENPVVIEGGTQAWMDAGLPVERSATKVISLERQVRIVAGSLVFIGVLLGWFVNRVFFGLSAFVGTGLVFAGITDFCGMGLLLAKLPWNQRVRKT